jgi:hypothetical protein
MAFRIEIGKLGERVLANPEIVRVLSGSQSPIDAAYVQRQLAKRESDLRTGAASAIAEVESIQGELGVKRGQIEVAGRTRWFERTFASIGGLLILLLLAYIVCRLFGLSLASFVDQWFAAALHRGIEQAATSVIGVLIVGLGVFTVIWRSYVRPNRRRDLMLSLDIDGIEKRLKNAMSLAESTLASAALQIALEIVNAVNDDFFQINLVTPNTDKAQRAPDEKVTSATGLSEIANSDNIVRTDPRNRIVRMIETLPGAAIGISGPRGVGKSTLLMSLCSTNLQVGGKEAISIYTASPVEYDPRDFLLHLFSSLCRQLLKTRGLDDDRINSLVSNAIGGDGQARIAGVTARRLGLLLTRAGFAAVVIGILVAFVEWQLHTKSTIPSFWDQIDLKPGPLILWGAVVAFLGVLANPFLSLRPFASEGLNGAVRIRSVSLDERRMPLHDLDDGLARYALSKLLDVQFQRSYTTGWSGALKTPVGVELGSNTSISFSQTAHSLPELVSEFKSFIGRIVAEERYGRVVIGIDELDKLHPAASPERFLNEIKTIFNIPQCYYLVSVSENALSNFERRGIPVRDVFDSAFDDILHIDYLTLQGSRNLLMRRILNLPGPFLCLCHILSGGLPRDLVRIARSMIALASSDASASNLVTIVAVMLREEAIEKLHATSIVAREARLEPELTNLLVQIADLEVANRSSTALAIAWSLDQPAVERTDAEEIAGARKLEQIRKELACYLEFLVLVQAFFGGMTTEETWRGSLTSGIIDALARIRQDLGLSFGIAEFRIRAVRAMLTKCALPAPTANQFQASERAPNAALADDAEGSGS